MEKICLPMRETQNRFDPYVGKIPRRRKWQPAPVFLLGKSKDRGAWQATVPGVEESDTTEQLSAHTHALTW